MGIARGLLGMVMAGGMASSAGLVGLTTAATLLAPASVARGDQYVDRANAVYARIPNDKRSDLVILPVLAKMDPVPSKLNDPLTAVLVTTTSTHWKDAEAWVTAKPQVDAIETLKKVTNDDNWKTAWAFGQPYGANAADPDIVMAGLYTELGENPTLAMAEFKYLPAIKKLELAAHYEATRLMAAGKGDDALKLMVHWVYFARQIADRNFMEEKTVGTNMLILALQRVRDLAWQDFRSEKRTITAETIRDMLYQRLDATRSVLNVERYLMPQGDFHAAEQITARTFTPNQRANAAEFARTFARVAAEDRPYRLFSENAKWTAMMPLHAETTETNRRVRGVFGDWDRRFQVGKFDLLHNIPPDWARIDRVQFSSLDLILGNLGEVLQLRNQFMIEAAGTRAALATYGFVLAKGQLPGDINSSTPQFIRTMDRDPFSRTNERFGFFVPIRDFTAQFGSLEIAKTLQPGREIDPNAPHLIRIFPSMMGNNYPNFEVPLRADTFVIYSAGPDGNNNRMLTATQMIRDDKGDYLIWPPVISLLRKNLQDTNKAP